MFVLKDATSSAQIEETRATMIDAIEAGNIEKPSNIPIDTEDIIHCKEALKYGVTIIEEGDPITLRFIQDIHRVLMTGACETQYSYPGEFRRGRTGLVGWHIIGKICATATDRDDTGAGRFGTIY